MSTSHVILLLGYASLLLELTVVAVPSVTSTWRLMQGRPSRRWALLELLPTGVAVVAFALPGVLCLWPEWHAALGGWQRSPWWRPWCSTASNASGVGLVLTGRCLTLLAVKALRRRVPTQVFVTAGPYAWSRNPALLGLHMFLLGGVAMFASVVTIAAFAVFVLHMHRRVRSEERHLTATGGDDYGHYLARVPRYVPTGRKQVPR